MNTVFRHLTVALSVTALAAACDSGRHPTAALELSAARRTSSLETTTTATADAGGTTQSGTFAPLSFVPGAPPLKTYDTTFVAHQGWKQNFVIFHEDGNYFMVLDVPASAQFVDENGNPVPAGAEVGIRVLVDSTAVSFEFGPHGSYFTGSRPVMLWVYLKYVALGSGGGSPSVWYQADATEPWAALPTTVDKAGNWLKVELRHFSNYAVAW
ncbi:MAG: hypothetical protein OEM67_13670 [Thermoleophilia bacterium]|nr:hypothetical protein [Thermoleophilia bacterium]